MRRGTISAGYNQVIPSHPIAKNVLKMKRKRAATMPVPLPVYLFYIALSWQPSRSFVQSRMRTMIASIAIENAIPAAPNSMLRQGQLSTTKTGPEY